MFLERYIKLYNVFFYLRLLICINKFLRKLGELLEVIGVGLVVFKLGGKLIKGY